MTTKKQESDNIKESKIKNQEIKILKSIDSFLEDNIKSRKRIGLSDAFKTWYKFKQKGSYHDKKEIKDWEKLLEKFLNQPTR